MTRNKLNQHIAKALLTGVVIGGIAGLAHRFVAGLVIFGAALTMHIIPELRNLRFSTEGKLSDEL